MAGDWIKMRTSLLSNPKVNGIAKQLEMDREVGQVLCTGFNGCMSQVVKRNVMRHVTVSSLLVVWGSANEHTKDGIFVNYELSDLDDMTGIPGFGDAMESVGWAIYDAESNCVKLPNFNEYNTSGAIRSANSKDGAQRQREYRERLKLRNSDVTGDVTDDATCDPREEKRREEKKNTEERESTARGSRLPADMEMPDAWGEWCEQNRPDLGPRETFAKFKDFWTAKPGKAGTKLDWLATWRNWCREERVPPGQRGNPGNPQSFAERDREAGMKRWEEQTGRVHPDRVQPSGAQVIDITPTPLELAND